MKQPSCECRGVMMPAEAKEAKTEGGGGSKRKLPMNFFMVLCPTSSSM